MPQLPIGDSTRRLITAVKKLETTLHTAGLPRFVARLPVCWLSWHYCRTLDQKIVRIRRIAGKFEQWVPTIRDFGRGDTARMELIDIDHSMRDDIEVTKRTMWELRGYCIDVGRMFEQLGYQSAGLKRRQAAFLQVLETSCISASTMQEALVAHDSAVLALLRAQQIHDREAAAASAT
nr:hypothetical protein [uncultured Duganella sp.]